MSGTTNQFGLRRHIPAGIRRAVRRECGFGCVVCGLAIATYEHFDPPFDEASEHNPNGIAFLCGACHDKKTRGIWSPDKISLARKNPITYKNGYARDAFDLQFPFTLHIGSSSFENVATVVRTQEGERWFTIEKPEAADAPLRLSVVFFDTDGKPSLEIDENEWKCMLGQWDTEVVGRTISVRRGPHDIALQLVMVPPNGMRLSRLHMRKRDLSVQVDRSGRLTIERNGGVTELEDCLAPGLDAVVVL